MVVHVCLVRSKASIQQFGKTRDCIYKEQTLSLKALSTGDTRRDQSQTERVALLGLSRKTVRAGRGAGGRGSQSPMMTPLIVRLGFHWNVPLQQS